MRVVNVFDAELEEGPGRDGFWFRAAAPGAALGAERIGAAVYEARAGVPIWPYHYHYPDEEWLYVLTGAPVLRDTAGVPTVQHPEGERSLAHGDLACLPEGPAGGRLLLNRSGEPARLLLLWTTGFPAAVCYPETGDWLLRPAPDAAQIRLRSARPGT